MSSSGCRKADRKRKSAQSAAYKNRASLNKRKNIERHKKRMEAKAEKRERWAIRTKRKPDPALQLAA